MNLMPYSPLERRFAVRAKGEGGCSFLRKVDCSLLPLAAQKDETPEEDVAIDYIAEVARCEADLPEPDSDPSLWTDKQRYARMVSVFAREALRLDMQLRNPPARRD